MPRRAAFVRYIGFMGVALSPYRVLGERPPAEALRALPVVEVRPPLVLSANATFDDEDFATVRYVVGDQDDALERVTPSAERPLWVYLSWGFVVAVGFVAVWALLLGGLLG